MLNAHKLRTYHTKACCNPEYAKRGIINNIRLSQRGETTDFNRDTIEELQSA